MIFTPCKQGFYISSFDSVDRFSIVKLHRYDILIFFIYFIKLKISITVLVSLTFPITFLYIMCVIVLLHVQESLVEYTKEHGNGLLMEIQLQK